MTKFRNQQQRKAIMASLKANSTLIHNEVHRMTGMDTPHAKALEYYLKRGNVTLEPTKRSKKEPYKSARHEAFHILYGKKESDLSSHAFRRRALRRELNRLKVK
jgi:hypothetical protein